MSGDKKIAYLNTLLEDMRSGTNELILHHTNELCQIEGIVKGISSEVNKSINQNHFFEIAEMINSRISFLRKIKIQRLRDTFDNKDENSTLSQYEDLYSNKHLNKLNNDNYHLANNVENNLSSTNILTGEVVLQNALSNLALNEHESTDKSRCNTQQIVNHKTDTYCSTPIEKGNSSENPRIKVNGISTLPNRISVTNISAIDPVSPADNRLISRSDNQDDGFDQVANSHKTNASGVHDSSNANCVVQMNNCGKSNCILPFVLDLGTEMKGIPLLLLSAMELYLFFGDQEYHTKFSILMHEMQQMCQSSENSAKFTSKDHARVALRSDYCICSDRSYKFYYRAKVTNWMMDHESNVVELYLCDTAETKYMHLEDLRYLPPRFAEFPAIATKCHLFNVTCKDKLWPMEAVEYFSNLQNCSFVIMEHIRDSYGVIVYDGDVNINNAIVEFGWAEDCSSAESLSPQEENALENLSTLEYETSGSSDACMAVMGYRPRDEARICSFYNPRTGGCFKGANCTKTHELINPDGWTNDRVPVANVLLPPMLCPKIGSVVAVKVTHVSYPNTFHGVYESDRMPHLGEHSDMTMFSNYMNSPDVVRSYRKLQMDPALGELVIAPYKSDGCYYRAKVVSEPDQDLVTVMYVDYGNSANVALEDLREFSSEFSQFPCQQALECSIFNVRVLPPISGDHGSYIIEMTQKMRSFLLHRTVKCRVVNALPNNLEVVATLEGYDLADYLENIGYAKKVENSEERPMPTQTVHYLPA